MRAPSTRPRPGLHHMVSTTSQSIPAHPSRCQQRPVTNMQRLTNYARQPLLEDTRGHRQRLQTNTAGIRGSTPTHGSSPLLRPRGRQPHQRCPFQRHATSRLPVPPEAATGFHPTHLRNLQLPVLSAQERWRLTSAGRIIFGRNGDGWLSVQFSLAAAADAGAGGLLNDWVEMTP